MMPVGVDGTFRGPPCPVHTTLDRSVQESVGEKIGEIKAYKLGKKRWSYNQVELVLSQESSDRLLFVKQAIHTGAASRHGGDAGVLYEIELSNEIKIILEAFLVHDSPKSVVIDNVPQTEWTLVDRRCCQRGCSGPILRSIQRFGKLGKRSWAGSPSPDVTDRTNHNMKDTRYMYLSFDEAGTHVGCRSFRLLVAAYNPTDNRLIGSAISPPVRVLANNDVPTGAAHLQMVMSVSADWDGWRNGAAPIVPSFTERLAMADSPSPTKRSNRLAQRTSICMDEPISPTSSVGEGLSADLVTTPLPSPIRHAAVASRDATYVHSDGDVRQQIPVENGQSSLLVEGPPPMSLEVDSTERQLHHQGSLASWLHGRKQEISTVPLKQDPDVPVLNPVVMPLAPHASVLLPHSIDYEASFPNILGSRHYVVPGQHEAFDHSGSPAGHPADGHLRDDPISTFVELMLTQGHPHPPVVELPAEEHDETPVLSVSLEEEHKFQMRSTCASSHNEQSFRPHVGHPAASMTTIMPSALGDLFADDGTVDFSAREDTVFPRTLTKQNCGFDLAYRTLNWASSSLTMQH